MIFISKLNFLIVLNFVEIIWILGSNINIFCISYCHLYFYLL